MSRGYITYCFSNWTKKTFSNGVMLMRNGKRTDDPIRHAVPAHWKLSIDYYIKPDPNFKNWTYSRCHKKLRRCAKPGDIIFFRTLWMARQYLIGYFVVAGKSGDEQNPVLIADPSKSLFIPQFKIPITQKLVMRMNPRATKKHAAMYHPNIFAMFLGREFLSLDAKRTDFLVKYMRERAKN
ncbi:MAG: hypothetical protein Q8P49_02935 [Candidatus Liptonbacteria bacterium]|nr:hypothetical protein [Candidatus Liptonbacteria bacterium]